MTEACLEARDLSRKFGRSWALRGFDVSLSAGSVVGLVGANGSGKSTALSLLAGTLRPTQGQVFAFGHALDAHPDPAGVRRRIALLGHRLGLYGDLSGLENLRWIAALYGLDRSGERLTKILDRAGLARAAHRPVRGYSRGMLQRLGLARVLVQEAQVWLLDEPGTGLDEAGIALLVALLAEGKERGVAVCVVTHQLGALGEVVDTVHRLDRGRLAQGDAP